MNVTERKYTPRTERVSSLPKLGSTTTRQTRIAKTRETVGTGQRDLLCSNCTGRLSLFFPVSFFCPLFSTLSFSPSLFLAPSVEAAEARQRSKTSCCERHVTTTASLCLAHCRRRNRRMESGRSRPIRRPAYLPADCLLCSTCRQYASALYFVKCRLASMTDRPRPASALIPFLFRRFCVSLCRG